MTCELGLDNGLLDTTSKAQVVKIDEYIDITNKNSCSLRDTTKKVKSLPRNGRKYLQFMHLIRDLYLQYIFYKTYKTRHK